jgi:hypothetical protein
MLQRECDLKVLFASLVRTFGAVLSLSSPEETLCGEQQLIVEKGVIQTRARLLEGGSTSECEITSAKARHKIVAGDSKISRTHDSSRVMFRASRPNQAEKKW